MKPSLKITGIATAFLLWGCAGMLDEDGALATVPYEINENKGIVVEARVNGQGPFAFTLDTGASISVVFDDLSNELGLEPVSGSVIVTGDLRSNVPNEYSVSWLPRTVTRCSS